MGRLVGQGAELLHSLWAHAERAVLRGRPPPPNIYRGGQAAVRNVVHANAAPTAAQSAAADVHTSKVSKAVVKTLKSFTGDAFSTVFVRVRQPAQIDEALAAQFRTMMYSKQARVPTGVQKGMGFRSQGRQRMHLPSAPSLHASRYGKVGFNPYKKTFAPYSLFSEQLVTHAPLALRAAADELEDEWQKYYKKRAKAASRVGMRSSTRRSGYLMERFAVDKMKPVSEIPTEVTNVIKALQTAESAADKAASTSSMLPEKKNDVSSLETSIHEAFSFASNIDEPDIITRLLIPLCPDLEVLLAPHSNTQELDPLSRSAFLSDVSRVTDSFDRHRLKRIVTIERAFDQEPLRPYRPKDWDENMLIELCEGRQDVRQVCLTVDFPNLTAVEVEQLLCQVMGYESVRWYASFLYEVRRDTSIFGDRDSYTGLDSPPTSSMMTDLGRDIDEMGAASLVSMADQRNSFDAADQHQLRYPTLELSTSHRSSFMLP